MRYINPRFIIIIIIIFNVVFSLDIAILLFGIFCGSFCHFHIAILISNFCHSSAVIFAGFIFRILYIWPPGGVQFKGEGNITVGRSLFAFFTLLICSLAVRSHLLFRTC